MSYIDDVIADCKTAKNAVPKRIFTMRSVDDLDGIKQAIYVITCDISLDKRKVFNDLKAYKATKQRACPKPNQPSCVMYVGSSTTGLKSRIKQHMGDTNSKGTHALHLKHWFDGEYTISVRVYDESPSVLQIIEDDLSYNLKPAFGKKGGNNK